MGCYSDIEFCPGEGVGLAESTHEATGFRLEADQVKVAKGEQLFGFGQVLQVDGPGIGIVGMVGRDDVTLAIEGYPGQF